MEYKTYIPHIAFELTSHCNLSCKFCYNIWKNDRIVSEEIAHKRSPIDVLNQLFQIANVKSVVLAGGEPTLHPELIGLVELCRKNGKFVTIVSNGQTADRTLYKELIELEVDCFELPILSSTPTVHNKLVRKDGAWENVMESYNEIVRQGGQVIPITVITKDNCLDIEDIVRLCYRKGAKQLFVNRFNLGGEGLKYSAELLPSAVELELAFHTLNDLSEKLKMPVVSMVSIPQCLLNPKDYPAIKFSYCPQNVLNRPLTLDTTGKLRICNHSPISLGNIFENDLEEMLTSNYVNSWRKVRPEYCIDCDKFDHCLAGCRAASEQMGYGIDKEDPMLDFLTNVEP